MMIRGRALALFAGVSFALCADARAGNEGRPVPVATFLSAAVTIYPGDEIVPAMVAEGKVLMPRSRPTDFAMQPTDVVGKYARRTLLRGQAIPLSAVRSKYIVFPGRSYPLLFRSVYIAVSTVGVALQRGSTGDVIDVRNIDSGLVVKGRVASGELIVVEGP